jgi:hypothetical protein
MPPRPERVARDEHGHPFEQVHDEGATAWRRRPPGEAMADLTHLDEKLAEVLGLARAAADATSTVAKMEGADDYQELLKRMQQEAKETAQHAQRAAAGRKGKKTAIERKAGETKREAQEMMKTYLSGEEEALDGFEFLSMAEAGELCHWQVLRRLNEKAGDEGIARAIEFAVPVQERHFRDVLDTAQEIASEEDPDEVA